MSAWPMRMVGVGVVLLLVGMLVWGSIGAQTSCGGGGGGDKPPPLPETGNLNGKVVRTGSETGPARGANVRIEGTDIATSIGEDGDGSFRLVGVPVGQQTVVVSYRGVVISITTNVSRGENTLLPFEVEIGEPPIEDKRPPTTTIIDSPRAPVEVESLPTGVEIEFEGEDDVTPAHKLTFSWQLDNGSWSSWNTTTRVTIEVAAEGVHTFRVKAKDEAGNEDTTPAISSFEAVVKEPPEDTRVWGLKHVRSIQFPGPDWWDGEGRLSGPTDLAIDSQGNFLIADGSLAKVKKYSPDGQYLSAFEVDYPEAVAVDSENYIYTCSFTAGIVQMFNPSGSRLARVAIAGASDIDLNEQDEWALVTRAQRLIKINIVTLETINEWEYPGDLSYHSEIYPAQNMAWSSIFGGMIVETDLNSGERKGSWQSGVELIGEILKLPGKDLLIVCVVRDTGVGQLQGYRTNKSLLWTIDLPDGGMPASICPGSADTCWVLDDVNLRVLEYHLVLME